MVNGKYDPVVQEEQAQATVKALKKAGYHPELREYETGHKITYGMFMEISRFLQDCLANKQ
jgi:predicted esterase